LRAHQEFGAFKKVIFVCGDQNPQVSGQGEKKLRNAGIEVLCLETESSASPPGSIIVTRAKKLIRTFEYWTRTRRPWVTIKTALNLEGTMIPPKGGKTFTSPDSLRFAHELRKRADAILTGSGTVLADQPLFTIRHVEDHPGKKRWLALMDRRSRVPESYLEQAKARGFQIHVAQDYHSCLDFLGSQGCLEVLVEAGPTLSEFILSSGVWNEHVLIKQEAGEADRVEIVTHDNQRSS
jgi:diaminohydroxyphosphoribosylaminopyrimidine deaminase/5-amino-6-(5-phosphoribosylamino)uracil reductase